MPHPLWFNHPRMNTDFAIFRAKTVAGPQGEAVPGISVRDHCGIVGYAAESLAASRSPPVRVLQPLGVPDFGADEPAGPSRGAAFPAEPSSRPRVPSTPCGPVYPKGRRGGRPLLFPGPKRLPSAGRTTSRVPKTLFPKAARSPLWRLPVCSWLNPMFPSERAQI